MLNKWELITDPDDRLGVLAELSRKLAFVGDAPVLKISALTGKGVHKLRPVLQEAITQYHRRVPTRDVNRVIVEAQQRHAGRRRGQGAVRRAGRQRPADVHAVRQPRAAADLRALPGALDPRGVRVRVDAAEAAGPQAERLMPWCDDCEQLLGAVGDDARGHVPDLRRLTSTPPTTPTTATAQAASAAPTRRRRGTSSCWSSLLVVYLVYRGYEMFIA